MQTAAELDRFYRAYIACLNAREWTRLADFVGAEVQHNGRRLGVDGYRAMLENDVAEIPDLRFVVELLVVDPPRVGARLRFDCSPRGTFLGLAVNGRRVNFSENVFYEIANGRIDQVWSVLDKAGIEAQL